MESVTRALGALALEQRGLSREGGPIPQVSEKATSRGVETRALGASAPDTSAAEGASNACSKGGLRSKTPSESSQGEEGIVGTSAGGNIQVIKTKLR